MPADRSVRLQGKVAFVTGGNTGIGAAICRRLAEEGAAVAVGWYEDGAGAEAGAARLPGRCVAVECDVTDEESVAAAVARARSELGAITVLVNNAAVLERTRFLEIDGEEWRRVTRVALDGAFHCSRAVIPGMIEAGGGSIVSIGSELATTGGELQAHYIAAKAGVVGLTRAIAAELGPQGIRANVVAPGPTESRMLSTELPPRFAEKIPLRRLGVPEDVAGAVAYLASDDAGYVSGQVLGVDGGLAMG